MEHRYLNHVIKLIKNLNEKYGMTFLVITHDIGLVEEISDRIMVFYGGLLVEVGNSDKILEKPKHPYTRGLLNACVDLNPYKDIRDSRVQHPRGPAGGSGRQAPLLSHLALGRAAYPFRHRRHLRCSDLPD